MRSTVIRSQPDDRNFEAIFEIPICTRATRSGWDKHDQSGQLLHVSESLAER